MEIATTKKEADIPARPINRLSAKASWKGYLKHPISLLERILVDASAILTVLVLASIIAFILIKGIPNLTLDMFAWKYTSENASMTPAILNTLIMTAVTLLLAVPVGVFAAIYMVEYASKGSKLVRVVSLTTETLSGIPSIVYGLFGYLFFSIALHFGLSMIGGALTLAIMVLPLIMRTTEEALKSVPDSYREGSFGLGAGRLRTVFQIVLPPAMPGILSGVILAIGRIVGETAALIFVTGTEPAVATNLMKPGRTLAVHMYAMFSEGLYGDKPYSVAVVLLVVVIGINALSGHFAKKLSGQAAQ